ncbi:hypothetical protein NQ315_000431 [Exocentrus adspersus]|uniref:Protein sleepless n=1 Tax=Exocentrus adspersus TaxID=1586481 RepID=A0AAV8VLR8_9CUCU|nr:hypothetical protein NQ315_000431 [Exocentrus adspersus]
MYREVCLAFAVGVFCVLLQNGQALQCWKCNSEYDVTCRDYFNLTKIEINKRYFDNANYGNRQIQPVRTDPHLEPCDEMYTSSYSQKNVCLKRVFKGVHGIPVVNRECRLVSSDFKVGNCPQDLLDRNKEVEYCGTCDHDGCNAGSAVTFSVLLAAVLPASVALLFSKK